MQFLHSERLCQTGEQLLDGMLTVSGLSHRQKRGFVQRYEARPLRVDMDRVSNEIFDEGFFVFVDPGAFVQAL